MAKNVFEFSTASEYEHHLLLPAFGRALAH